MSTKKQFLDPIGAGCKFILLKSFEPNTKLRIVDHTVQVVPDSIIEKMIYRPWVYKDSREDIAALYPVIVRFIELYLNVKKDSAGSIKKQINKSNQPNQLNQTGQSNKNINLQNQINQINQTNQTNQTNQINQINQTNQIQTSQFEDFEIDNNFDIFGMGNISNLSNLNDGIISHESETNLLDSYIQDHPPFQQFNQSNQINQSNQPNQFDQPYHSINMTNTNEEICDDADNEKCYKALITIAHYMIEGMEELQKTYEFGNAVMALEYYKTLLRAGINQTYTQDMLPKHLKDFTSKNFLDNDKIRDLWKNKDIIEIAKLFELCFGSDTKSPSAIKAYRIAIESMLNDRDQLFKHMISSTNNS